eukprot:scaffold11866_cov23-Cyclotella_meneghiniana.AAC.1
MMDGNRASNEEASLSTNHAPIKREIGHLESNENDQPPAATKRVKTSTDNAGKATVAADSWAAVMEFLQLSDVLSLSSTCRVIYHDAVPLVTTLHITKSHQMNPLLAKRFRDVRDIYIYSLVQEQAINKWSVDFETSVRAATFLSNNFVKLERVCFGSTGHGELEPYVHSLAKYSTDNHNNMSHLELCPPRCQLEVCRRACESFPLEAVAKFECQKSSCDQ